MPFQTVLHRLISSRLILAGAMTFMALVPAPGSTAASKGPDRCLVPPAIRDPILNEFSGELAYLHVQLLAANRDRAAQEYEGAYFETEYLREMATRYGLSDVQVDFFPSQPVWDAEEGDLWLVTPVRKKFASVTQVPAALARGSLNADVEAEVVYVGAGREADYAGKDVQGKIVLGSTSVSSIFASAVNQRGAAGALGISFPALSPGYARYAADQVGWASVPAAPDRGGFGFSLSPRQLAELQSYIERGQRVVMRAHVRTRTYPGKMNVVSAAIPGTDPSAGELLFVAHAFETIATPGANDNCTGVATILEIGRTLTRLIRDGDLPPPRRTLRFLWVPEISGSRAFMFKHPELQQKLLAVLNFDMTGANLSTTDSYLRMKMTPDSRPSYLNDLIANLLQFVDQTDIRTPQGNNGPFNYRLAPVATITSGSDHSVFNDGGIPAMQFNHWPDNFYHSSEDRVIHADPTELKRVGVVAGAAFAYLATAGAAEARDLAWEASANGQKWIAEVTRQAVRLMGEDPARLHEQYRAAMIKVTGAYQRARGGVASVANLAAEPQVSAAIKNLTAALEASRDTNARLVEETYRTRCAALGLTPRKFAPTEQEQKYATLVPRRLFPVYSPEAQQRTAAPPSGPRPARTGPRLPGLASSEVANFIDGTRTILDIYYAVRAECGNLVIGSTELKFAYVLSPEAPDIELEAVVAVIQDLQKAGVVEIVPATRR